MTVSVVSCPGKVLLAGGYLVLDPKYSGIVVSTSSRFYSHISDSTDEAKHKSPYRVVVRSPQFLSAEWVYIITISEENNRFFLNQENEPIASTSKNKFVHLALHRTLLLILEVKGISFVESVLSKSLVVTIVGDNDFYSQRAQLASLNLSPTLSSLSQIPPFAYTSVPLTDVHKTGLGSSAALITSLVTSLLLHFSVISSADLSYTRDSIPKGLALTHNLAQYVHCLAQGKVGSGFDVSSAVYGSHKYTRFDPEVLQPLMADSLPTTPLLPLLSATNLSWNNRIEPFDLPPRIRLMLADVDAGSDTPSLVGKVLLWRKEHPEQANQHWQSLDEINQNLGALLLRLTELASDDPTGYSAALSQFSSLPSSEWNAQSSSNNSKVVQDTLFQVHEATQLIRSKMKQMGEFSGVPIEPHEQTNLLSACIQQAGVIGGGVPGAGGYDAIWLLVIDDERSDTSAVSRVEKVWNGWKEMDVSPLSALENRGSGVRVERVEDIKGLKEAITRRS